LLALVPLAFFGWFGLNNIRSADVSPKITGPIGSFSTIVFMLLIGFVTAIFGLWLLLPRATNGSGLCVPKELLLLLVVASTVFLLKLIPGEVRSNLSRQYEIFNNKHMGDECYLHHDLWFVYWLCRLFPLGD
jgi:NNP family nitrate/nitrite transporter-like MFS transporter